MFGRKRRPELPPIMQSTQEFMLGDNGALHALHGQADQETLVVVANAFAMVSQQLLAEASSSGAVTVNAVEDTYESEHRFPE